jgi:hypothetical protein
MPKRGEPVTISRVTNHITTFMVVEDQSLHQSDFDLVEWGDLGPFSNIGGKLIAPPAVMNTKAILLIFHIGVDRALHHKSWDGHTYNPSGRHYERLGGTFTHTSTAVTVIIPYIDIIGVRDHNGVGQRSYQDIGENHRK